MVSVVVF
ncbi:acetyltransferase, putative, partial [Vibrio cholerae O1 str. Nep-21106]